MEYLFLLAERVVHHFKEQLNANKEMMGFITFKESIITNTSVKIVFSNAKDKIICSLGTHPLDMPWTFSVKIVFEEGREFELHKWKIQSEKNNETPYEVYPNLLNDPEGKGNELAKLMSVDLVNFVKENKSK